mmetsp:Transcript_27449/g.89452  ORF Transcript_27449/g.89452 Transcript_27449/m.89452 type:complete len:340 (+) Transcript_27449:205-1224(+)
MPRKLSWRQQTCKVLPYLRSLALSLLGSKGDNLLVRQVRYIPSWIHRHVPRITLISIRAVLEMVDHGELQEFHNFFVLRHHREIKTIPVVPRPHDRHRPELDQNLANFQVAKLDGPQQWGEALGVLHIHHCTVVLYQQQRNSRAIESRSVMQRTEVLPLAVGRVYDGAKVLYRPLHLDQITVHRRNPKELVRQDLVLGVFMHLFSLSVLGIVATLKSLVVVIFNLRWQVVIPDITGEIFHKFFYLFLVVHFKHVLQKWHITLILWRYRQALEAEQAVHSHPSSQQQPLERSFPTLPGSTLRRKRCSGRRGAVVIAPGNKAEDEKKDPPPCSLRSSSHRS